MVKTEKQIATQSLKSNLNQHIKSIHGGKKFKCTICGYNFSQLKRHIARVHEGKKPFKCDICHASFTQKNNMKQHIRNTLFNLLG